MTEKQFTKKKIQQEPNLAKAAEALVGLSYYEWERLKVGVDAVFRREQGEFNRTLELSSPEEVMRYVP
ncbi:MAG: hypothetical protein K2N36_07200 [Ruminiclostridium sp.]|nr:hypothetical protein [Ruminiclostridium sp.]